MTAPLKDRGFLCVGSPSTFKIVEQDIKNKGLVLNVPNRRAHSMLTSSQQRGSDPRLRLYALAEGRTVFVSVVLPSRPSVTLRKYTLGCSTD